MNAAYTIPNELLGQTPRRVRFKDFQSIGGLVFMWLFLLPLLCIGIGVLVHTAGTSLVCISPTLAAAVITGKQPESNGGYRIDLAYNVNGATISSSSDVSSGDYSRLQRGQRVSVKYLSLLPAFSPEIQGASAERSRSLEFSWLITLGWNVVVAAFVQFAFVRPFIVRRVYMYGVPTTGEIVEKRTDEDESSRHYILRYRFTADTNAGDTIVFDKMLVTKDEYDAAGIGQSATVLYLPDKPKHSALYPYGPYAVSLP
jgi:hypothetical protein